MKSQRNPVNIVVNGSNSNIVRVLRQRAKQHGAKLAYTFLADGEQEQASLTFEELDLRARRIAARLRRTIGAGERALLLYPPGLEYVTAFFGCLYAGVIAVPAYPPRENGSLDRIVAITNDCQFAVVLTDSARDKIASRLSEILRRNAVECVDTTELEKDDESPLLEEHDLPLGDTSIAFLQYTSGSTALPRGVMVTHANLMDNEMHLQSAFKLSDKTVTVSWLPIYHDMGLIGAIISAVYVGARCILMPPASFVQKPVCWLSAVSKYRGTFSLAPNFAYDLCVRRVAQEQKVNLDLSSWTSVCNGAEPVRAGTIKRFIEAFGPCGFKAGATQPAYGLAEATLMVSCATNGREPVVIRLDSSALAQHRALRSSDDQAPFHELVGCGRSNKGHKILIVDPKTRRVCRPGQIGEIWLSSPSVAKGYWNRPAETEATFGARLADSNQSPFLRTGDLGLIYERQLCITGRLKDLILINGQNHYPQDIEFTVEQCHPGLRPGFGAAFSIEGDGEERLVIAYEVERSRIAALNAEEMTDRIYEAVAQKHEVAVHAVALVMPGGIPKTSSGKIQRQLCRDKFLAGKLKLVRERALQDTARVSVSSEPVSRTPASAAPMEFSLFYFSSNEADFQNDKYRLLMEGAKFADRNGFDAVWIPERHFHAFGGIYPNPSVLGAAVAMITDRVRIRAGSVVLPLHNPIRVAEEWSVVDNLSRGRIDLAFARGWNPNDFALWPDRYADSSKALYEGMKTVTALWRGEAVPVLNGKGENTQLRIYPLPKQQELQIWITCTGGVERFIEAGEGGWNVLTALLFQSVEELEAKINAYREARRRRGFDANAGRVTLMMHTFLGADDGLVKEAVRGPFSQYLESSVDLWRQLSRNLHDLDPQEKAQVLEYAFERYYRTSALFGTPDTCFELATRLATAGVNEIACLIDFGVEQQAVLDGLYPLNMLKERFKADSRADDPAFMGTSPLSSGARNEDVEEKTAQVSTVIERKVTLAPAVGALMGKEQIQWDERRPEDRKLLQWVKRCVESAVSRVVRHPDLSKNTNNNFFRMAIDSVKAIEILDAIQLDLRCKISPAKLFDFPTIDSFSLAIAKEQKAHLLERMTVAALNRGTQTVHTVPQEQVSGAPTVASAAVPEEDGDIAIIGLACKFPGAPDLVSFWDLLREGRDATGEVPPDHWDWRLHFDPDPSADKKTYSRWGGFVDKIDLFDAPFFDISPEEAQAMDPQQRIFIETAWQTLEHAGYSPSNLRQLPVGVFVGASYNNYYPRVVDCPSPLPATAAIANQNAIIANRVSFFLNLSGPSILIDTLCSSSLIAVHLACQSLRQGECVMALAGGVNSLLSPQNYIAMSRMKIHSPDGRCRAFDAEANGIVYGEGAGAILLKPLKRAQADGDCIYAVIKGSAVNHGGRSSALAAPQPQMQAQVVRQALDAAGINAESISYIEAHGTGTALGDALEVHALARAFEHDTSRLQFCRIGSVKTNIGHLESAAGIAGIIKVVLAMQNRQLPPSLHFKKPNPLISFEASPFQVQNNLSPWDSTGPRRAGISAFGIGGSNAHVILQEAPTQQVVDSDAGSDRPVHLLTLSAKTASALQTRAGDLASFLSLNPDVRLPDLCFTENVGREHFTHRLAVVVRDRASLLSQLQAFAETGSASDVYFGHAKEGRRPKIAFVFSAGSHDPSASLELLKREPALQQAVDRCDAIWRGYVRESPTIAAADRASSFIAQNVRLFALQYTLWQLWRSWGVVPDVVTGFGVGEFVAAHVAGSLSLDDAIRLTVEEAKVLSRRDGANIDPSQKRALVESSTNTVTSLPQSSLDQFEGAVRRTDFRPLQIPMVSSLDGRLLRPGEFQTAGYWHSHASIPSQRDIATATIRKELCTLVLDIGRDILSAEFQPDPESGPARLQHRQSEVDDWEALLGELGSVYLQGGEIDWSAADRHFNRRRLALPTYPFERQRYWIDAVIPGGLQPKEQSEIAAEENAPLPALVRQKEDVLQRLRRGLAGLLKCNQDQIEDHKSLLEMGADSLVLTNLIHRVENEFRVQLYVWQFFAELATVDAVGRHIFENVPLDGVGSANSTAVPGLSGQEGGGHPELEESQDASIAENLASAPSSQEGTSEPLIFEDMPLSAGQKGLWFLQRMAPDHAAYNMVAAAQVQGSLDVPALRRAFQALVDRHGALRTTFHLETGPEPFQRVHLLMDLEFQFMQAAVGQDGCQKQISDLAWRPFDLEQQSPFRVVVIRRNPDEHVLLLVMHHIIGDFWSLALIFDELTKLYLQETTNQAARLVALTTSYSDHIDSQNRDLAGARGEQLWEYWRETLKPPLTTLELRTDHVRSAVQTFRGASLSLSLGPDLTQSLRELASSHHATLFMTLLASFQLLLHRYTGQEDIVIAAPASGRTRQETANVVGYFVNPLVMRTNISRHSNFSEVLAQTIRSVSGALQHQDYPLPLLIERLHPVRDPGISPLFQIMFILEKAQYPELDVLSSYAMGVTGPEMKVGPLSFRSLAMPERQVPFDLTLMMAEQSPDLVAAIHYNRDLFEEDTIRRMLDRYRLLLSGVVADPARPIADLTFLTDQETKRLQEWNATQNAYSSSLLHDLFRQQAWQTPENVAVEDAAETLTYRELDARSDRVAASLKDLRIRPETVVGVCLERSVRCAVTMLGILKAGAAYLPLDPALPRNRLRYMIEDAGVAKVVTEPTYVSSLPADCVLLAEELEHSSQSLVAAADNRVRSGGPTQVAENLAYIVYTSGSTGKPKGVQVTHRSVTNFLASMVRDPGLTGKDVLVSVTTISFDIFGLELYLPLLAGARVVFASREVSGDGNALLDTIRKCGATVMQATPATWQLLSTAAKEELPAIKALVGGDILPSGLARSLLAAGCAVWNLYGPSETAIWSASHRVTTADTSSPTVPIGRPIGNTQIYIMDANLQVSPPGVPGELVIGGDGVARGYIRLAGLTAEKFVPDAVSNRTGARLYRTGDLARLRPDGLVEFLGRLDNQVKVRGHRIELGEIESALLSIPGIEQAAVVSRRQRPSDHRLFAYIVLNHREKSGVLDPAILKQVLLDQLPDSFVPSDFAFLDALPLTPNGKVDRNALAQREYHPSRPAAYILPRSSVEQVIAQAWRETLKLERVSVYDNFFDLGGHSLLLADVHARLSDQGYKLSIVDLLRYPAIAALAAHINSDMNLPGNVQRQPEAKRSRPVVRPFEAAETDIAIIGMAGRFPKAANVEEFWTNIVEGNECISFFSAQELAAAGVDQALLANPRFVPACGSLEGSELFDAEFFGFNPRQAALMDPQQRIFLESAWHALENAGYDSSHYSGRIGVFAGSGINTYLFQASRLLNASQSIRYQAFIGNDKDFLSTLVSYKLDLRGPSATIQTACSTSLVAIHMACQSLLRGECDMAMAGAVSARLPQETGHVYEEEGILSPDGHCRAFDVDAQGTVAGNGVGIVVLKQLHAAIHDGDCIRVVIKGSSINNDGNRKVGYTAPSIEGQAEVISEALAIAGVQPETVSYIETHGSATPLGDPAEIAALTDVFLNCKKQSCAIGSVKTNIGHLDTAAGVAGLIKTICAMEHKILPPSLHYTAPNPRIDFAKGPFYVNTTAREWPRNGGPLRAGISAFGIGGTNAHIVLEEAPPQDRKSSSRPWHLLLLSARTLPALAKSTRDLQQALKARPEVALADVAYTTQVGRRAFAHRCAVLCNDRDHAIRALEQLPGDSVYTSEVRGGKREVIFLFPAQPLQTIDMGRGLYETEPVFRREVDACAEFLRPHLGLDLRSVLFPSADLKSQTSLQLSQTEYTLSALFVVEYALACLWMELGVQPAGMLGYGFGEYVAACLAGVLSLADALALVVVCGRLMHSAPPASMLRVLMEEKDLLPLLSENLSLVAVDNPSACVVSGAEESVELFERTLTAQGVLCTRLSSEWAAHAHITEPLLAGFLEHVNRVQLRAPMIPYVSSVTGVWITKDQSTDPNHWVDHLRKTVRFAEGLECVLSDPTRLLLEVGPGDALTMFSRRLRNQPLAVASLAPPVHEQDSEGRSFLRALAQLWAEGVEIDWQKLSQSETRRRVPLPGYPFERQRYWIDSELTGQPKDVAAAVCSETKTVEDSTKLGSDKWVERTTSAVPHQSPRVQNRKESILSLLLSSMSRAVELDSTQMDSNRSFLQMGFDSLVLLGALQEVRRTFNVSLSLRQLFDELSTLNALADYIDRNLAPNAEFAGWPPDLAKTADNINSGSLRMENINRQQNSSSRPVVSTANQDRTDSAASPFERYGRSHSDLVTVMAEQTAAMSQLFQRQLEVLSRQPQATLPDVAPVPESKDDRHPAQPNQQVDETLAQVQPWVPYQPLNPGSLENLTPRQRVYLDRFIGEYVQRTKSSKEYSQTYRHTHADLRTSVNFRLSTKEMRYPIVGVRSKGSQIWDLDGNRYTDFTMGFGVNLFGHKPDFVMESIQAQLEKGIQVGPQTELAGEVATLICELTGMERVAFSNSGTEAVMSALRLARVSTGRRKVALFAGSNHGTSDSVLVGARMEEGKLNAVPLVPGVPPGMVEDMMVLSYGSTRSLEMIRASASELAAVLVEPVQSRKPELQPRAFLQELRSITQQSGIALIFDEIISGFRVHQKGAQGWFGVQADLATYGKVIGGGMPIGVIAGKAAFMDCVDGGLWNFGDMSVPAAKTTLHTGTFYKHPLAMAAGRAVMLEIKRQGPALFEKLNAASERFAQRLDDCFMEMEAPLKVVHFGSLFRLAGPMQLLSSDALDLLFWHLVHNGVYVWEGRNCFVSTAHSQEDLDSVVDVVRESLVRMRDAGFLHVASENRPVTTQIATQAAAVEVKAVNSASGSNGAPENSGQVQRTLQTPAAPTELWLMSRSSREASLAYNQSIALRLRGRFDRQAFAEALITVTSRHEALRTVFDSTGEWQRIWSAGSPNVAYHDLAALPSDAQDRVFSEWCKQEAERTFDLVGHPLWRVAVLKLKQEEHLVVFTIHHIIVDGLATGLLLHEIGVAYSAHVNGRWPELPPALQLRDYLNFLEKHLDEPARRKAAEFWLHQLEDSPEARLPLRSSRTTSRSGARLSKSLEPSLKLKVAALSSQLNATLFVTLLTAYDFFLSRITGHRDFVVVTPVAGQMQMESPTLIADCSNLIGLRSRLTPEVTFAEWIDIVKRRMLDCIDYQLYPFAEVIRKLRPRRDPSCWFFFNIDRSPSPISLVGIVVEYVPLPIAYTAFDFGVNFTIFSGGIEVAFDYRTALFSAETVSQWFGEFEELLKRVTADPNLSLSDWTKGQPLTAQSGETGAELSYVAPRTQVEQTVAAIWEEVLGRDRISIFSDFFELGGHSLLATQMVARMRDIFGVDISVEDLFQQPSIVGVAGIMEKLLRKRERRPQESIQNCSHERPLPVSFAQRRLWLIHELDPSSAAYNVTGALRLLGILDYAALESALDSLIKRHESLRTVFLKGDGEPVQQVLPHKPFQLERVDIAGPVPIEERSSVLVARGQEAARHSFDLAHGPLFRAQLFKFNEDDHVLIITIHHIVCDGWSGAIILKEIGIFYDAFCSKKPVDLAPLSIQFADYAVWQRNWLQGETLQGQLDYWVQHLTGAPQFLKLPTAHPRNAVPSLRGTHEAFHLEEALSLAVAQFCRREGVTPFMTLLAAFSLLLALHSGQDDLIVGTDIANRDRVEAEDLVGHFVNLLPLRLKPADQLTFREYVRQVRKVTLGAYRHQDVPFDLLVRALRPERKMTNTPLVQVLFVLHNFAPPSVISEKVRMEQVPLPMETSEFELILSIQEERGKFIGTVGYSTDLYQRAWICSLISQLQDLLRSAIGASDSLISSLVHARSLHPHELSEAKSLRADVSIS